MGDGYKDLFKRLSITQNEDVKNTCYNSILTETSSLVSYSPNHLCCCFVKCPGKAADKIKLRAEEAAVEALDK